MSNVNTKGDGFLSMRAWLLLVALGPTLTGCYKYLPLQSAVPTPGEAIQVSLTREGSDQMTRFYGPSISQLDAQVLAVRADTLELAVRTVRTSQGFESFFKGDTVALPLSSVASISGRRFAVGPTVLLGGLVVGGAVGAVAALSGGDRGNGISTTGGSAQHQ
jgi:hypothetical protein